MYKLRNKALDNVLTKYNIEQLEDLTTDQVYAVATDTFKVVPEMKLTEAGKPAGIDKYKTIDKIKAALSINMSAYLPIEYWEERHHELNQELGILEEVAKHEAGEQTFRLFARHKMGFYRLAPGEIVELNVPGRWVSELKESAMGRNLEILGVEDEEEEEEVKEISVEDVTDEEVENSKLNEMSMSEIREVVRGLNINSFGKSKQDLIRIYIASTRNI